MDDEITVLVAIIPTENVAPETIPEWDLASWIEAARTQKGVLKAFTHPAITSTEKAAEHTWVIVLLENRELSQKLKNYAREGSILQRAALRGLGKWSTAVAHRQTIQYPRNKLSQIVNNFNIDAVKAELALTVEEPQAGVLPTVKKIMGITLTHLETPKT